MELLFTVGNGFLAVGWSVTGSFPSIASSHNRRSSSDNACSVITITRRSFGVMSKQNLFSIDSDIRRVQDFISIVSVVVLLKWENPKRNYYMANDRVE